MVHITYGRCLPQLLETDIFDGVPDKVLDFVTNYRVPLKRLGNPKKQQMLFCGYSPTNLLLSTDIPWLWMAEWKQGNPPYFFILC